MRPLLDGRLPVELDGSTAQLVEVVDLRVLAGLSDEAARARAGQPQPVTGDASVVRYGPLGGVIITYDLVPAVFGGALKLTGAAWGEALTIGSWVDVQGLPPSRTGLVAPVPGAFTWPVDNPWTPVDVAIKVEFGTGSTRAVAELDVAPGNAAAFHGDAILVSYYQCGSAEVAAELVPVVGAFVTYSPQTGVGIRTLRAFSIYMFTDEAAFIGSSSVLNIDVAIADPNIQAIADAIRLAAFPEL